MKLKKYLKRQEAKYINIQNEIGNLSVLQSYSNFSKLEIVSSYAKISTTQIMSSCYVPRGERCFNKYIISSENEKMTNFVILTNSSSDNKNEIELFGIYPYFIENHQNIFLSHLKDIYYSFHLPFRSNFYPPVITISVKDYIRNLKLSSSLEDQILTFCNVTVGKNGLHLINYLKEV